MRRAVNIDTGSNFTQEVFMEHNKTPTVELSDQELDQVSGGSNPLIDAFVQGFQKGSTEGAPKSPTGRDPANHLEWIEIYP